MPGLLRAFLFAPLDAAQRARAEVPVGALAAAVSLAGALAAAALLGGTLVACAPAGAGDLLPGPAFSPPAEDAVPYLLEHEVDVPARPVDPIEGDYPPELRALGVQGEVEARVAVLPDGSVAGARLVASTHELFTAAAREAIGRARFHPALRDGRPVASWVVVRLRFRLEE